jgi:hypothetical protein
MKKLLSRTWMQNLTAQQRDVLLGLLLLLLVAILYYFQWAFFLTGLEGSKVNIDQPSRFFWWANDSGTYRMAGEWLFGREDNDMIANRPWLYPLMLGLIRTLFGGRAETVSWFAQFLMWLGSGTLIYVALHNATRSTVWAIAGAVIFYSHPSPLLLTFHGMTETLNILLICAFCWVLTTAYPSRIYYALLLIALTTVTKPIYLAFLGLLILYILWQYRGPSKVRQAGLIAILLLPIWVQLVLSALAIGKPTLSGIGGYTFRNYLVADVYMREEGTEWRPTTALIEDWDTSQQLRYLWEHQRSTLLTIRNHLIDSNLLVGSFYALGEGNPAKQFSLTMNVAAAYIHLLMLPLLLYYLVSPKYTENKETIALLYTCFILQFLTSGISTGQEDRLMITALPLWLIAYVTVLRWMFAPKVLEDAPLITGSLDKHN